MKTDYVWMSVIILSSLGRFYSDIEQKIFCVEFRDFFSFVLFFFYFSL
jgi:hypothetical protein